MVKALALSALLALSACATTSKGDFCSISSPIRLTQSAIDALSDEEVRDMLTHNERGKALCGWKQ